MGRKSKTPNIKRQERRRQSVEKRRQRAYSGLKDVSPAKALEYKKERIAQEKERYMKAHEKIAMMREKMTNGEMNEAIRYLYDRGIVKGTFQYYEDFLEQHEMELDMEEISNYYDELEAAEKEVHENLMNEILNPSSRQTWRPRSKKLLMEF